MRKTSISVALLLGGMLVLPIHISAEDYYDDSTSVSEENLNADNVEKLKNLMNQMQHMSPEELNAFLSKFENMSTTNDTSAMQDLIEDLQNQSNEDTSQNDDTSNQPAYEPYKTLESPSDRYQTRQSAAERFNRSRSKSRFGTK